MVLLYRASRRRLCRDITQGEFLKVLETVRDAQGRGRAIKDSRAVARSLVPIAEEIASVRVVTYNIHTCVGVDRRYDPARIVAVLRRIGAGIPLLHEAGGPPHLRP